MTHNTTSIWRWLAAVVIAHLAVSMVHGTAHTGAHVEQSAPALAFVFIVILAGPVVGLGLTWPAPRGGHWVIAATLAGSLLFGVVNHFVFDSPDHVSHVAREWRSLFTWTATLLAVTEAVGVALAIRGALLLSSCGRMRGDGSLSKAEASKRIDELPARSPRLNENSGQA